MIVIAHTTLKMHVAMHLLTLPAFKLLVIATAVFINCMTAL